MCDLVFIVVHDEEKSDVSISRLYLDGTGSCCLANTIVAYEILLYRARNLLSMERKAYLRRSGESRPPRLVHGCFREEILEAITEPAGRYVRGKSVHAGSVVVPTESSREQHVALSGLGVSKATVTGSHLTST